MCRVVQSSRESRQSDVHHGGAAETGPADSLRQGGGQLLITLSAVTQVLKSLKVCEFDRKNQILKINRHGSLKEDTNGSCSDIFNLPSVSRLRSAASLFHAPPASTKCDGHVCP